MRTKLFLLFGAFIVLFTLFSYTVAKEKWTKIDFDTTVKIQDHIPRKFDVIFSYFSLLGSVEVTFGFCILLSFLSLLRGRFLAILGWFMIVPASMGEIFGKLVLFHPSPPVFMHRSILPTSLPSFYVHTDYSYPSGHMARTVFIITVFISLFFFQIKDQSIKLLAILSLLLLFFLMLLTRIYLGEHWLSDVLGGSMLGAGFGFFASILILQKKSKI